MTEQEKSELADNPYIKALLEEKRGYEMRGLPERVKMVEDEIKRAARALRGKNAAPAGRSATPNQQTTNGGK